ncbi:MAG: tRNA uridine-5-carboxymethylaminomethyl(34) synthesis GTPase MnmE [Bacteroidaceae bacterium]|nr:tRNA uridine-5-carboxymethylaminomethyl(34) synthesis GTPase MnmE [Bacteroidaceae bacterium]
MNDTVCALATPAGGALGIIRVSGDKAIAAVDALFRTQGKPLAERQGYSLAYGTLRTTSGEEIDDAVVSLFRAPHSYTGEDSVEISCHGSRYVLNKVLEQLVLVGCRMARAGEFSQRAFLNGKMDFSQAEAVADLIASSNRATHQLAMSQLRGHFSSELVTLREQLLQLTTLLELELDFSDHEDLEFADRTELLALAQKIDTHITRLARTFETGQAIKQGIPVAIVGKTNVGKSTLLNRLLRDERAIVSDIHGTTRDTIEDTIELQGITFRFIDTAGLRQTSDEIEQIGITRTYAAIDKARIVLWLIDTAPTEAELQEMQTRCADKKLLLIQNKIDLTPGAPSSASASDPASESAPTSASAPASTFISASVSSFAPDSVPSLAISAKHGTNIDALEAAIYAAADIPELSSQDVIVTNARHYEALTRSHATLQRVLDGLNANLSGDLLAEDLRQTLEALAEITGGAITPQETLNNIFSHFCVGK